MPTATAVFQSTCPVRGTTDPDTFPLGNVNISIHAPLTGRNETPCISASALYDFNPRAPYGARRPLIADTRAYLYFNPRAPYGARRGIPHAGCSVFVISIHAPLTGRDSFEAYVDDYSTNFNPRAPYGARRWARCRGQNPASISIHAPLTGRDIAFSMRARWIRNFNPRAPYGARLPTV